MEAIDKILNHLKSNPQITEQNYSNINPFFGRFKNESNSITDEIYIGYDYIITIQGNKIFAENEHTGKITKRIIK